MLYLNVQEVLIVHDEILLASGGLNGIRDRSGLESAIAQPQMTMFGNELYPTLAEKAAIIGYSLILNHPFVDGNKRIGHAAMEIFLLLNGYEIDAPIDEQEHIILEAAAGKMSKEDFTTWLKAKIVKHLYEQP